MTSTSRLSPAPSAPADPVAGLAQPRRRFVRDRVLNGLAVLTLLLLILASAVYIAGFDVWLAPIAKR